MQRIEAAGRAFDPWEHEAVAFQETAEHPPGHVLGLVREGYKLHGRVLRAAQVVVARAPQGDTTSGAACPNGIATSRELRQEKEEKSNAKGRGN